MKKINKLFAFIALIATFSISSCSEVEPLDPVLSNQIEAGNGSGNGNAGGGNGSTIAGRYVMTAFNTSVPTDLNSDGNASVNQMNETACFNNNIIEINTNNTFTATSKGIDIDLTTTTPVIECFTDPSISGTWSVSNNVISFNYVDGGTPQQDSFVVAGNTLTLTVPDGEIVGTTSTGEPIYLDADITIVYTKQ